MRPARTTFVYIDGKLIFPDSRIVPEQRKLLQLREAFVLAEGDVVIIGSSNSYEAAEKGAITAALSLTEEGGTSWGADPPIVRDNMGIEDMQSIALAVHELVGRLPVTMKSKNSQGVRCEEGEVIDYNYYGPILEEVIKKGKVVRRTPQTGPYRGVPVVVVPMFKNGEAIAAFGIVDITHEGVFGMISKMRKEQNR